MAAGAISTTNVTQTTTKQNILEAVATTNKSKASIEPPSCATYLPLNLREPSKLKLVAVTITNIERTTAKKILAEVLTTNNSKDPIEQPRYTTSLQLHLCELSDPETTKLEAPTIDDNI